MAEEGSRNIRLLTSAAPLIFQNLVDYALLRTPQVEFAIIEVTPDDTGSSTRCGLRSGGRIRR